MDHLASKPYFTGFMPVIPYQKTLLEDIDKFDYSLGVHEILLSGSVGSAKSIVAAHAGIRHCLDFNGAKLLIGRLSLPDLKSTIFQEMCEHLEMDPKLEQGRDYRILGSSPTILFANGSEIISRSWRDKKFKKFRSLKLSAAIIEELTENDDVYWPFYNELIARIGRVLHIKQRFIIGLTNPDDPDHPVYNHFFGQSYDTRHVYESKTSDNLFLPPNYEDKLREIYDELTAKRMIDGEWLAIKGKVIYMAYTDKLNFVDVNYKIDTNYPIEFSWDFNIADGKPLSVALSQRINKHSHFFDEIVIDSISTPQSCDEIDARGYIRDGLRYKIMGDATGRHKDTRSTNTRSDYDIIEKFFTNHRKRPAFEMCVPRSNPPIKKRHNLVNGQLCNAKGQSHITIYRKAKTLRKGLKLTKLKEGASYIEDDSKPYQHITTAAGYNICYHLKKELEGTTMQSASRWADTLTFS